MNRDLTIVGQALRLPRPQIATAAVALSTLISQL
jgi:hypothetical protein